MSDWHFYKMEEVDMNAIIDAQNCEAERIAQKNGTARLTIIRED